MPHVKAYAATSATAPLAPHSIERREPGAHDVQIEILYAGICHSDIHTVRGDWGPAAYPVVPGHEIVGRVTAVGGHVKKFKVGDLAGVGCFVDSCRSCAPCQRGLEQFCELGVAFTYNSTEMDRKTPTYGGYSTQIVVDENYTLRVSDKLPITGVAPLLCAGITTYSPLREWKVGPGHKVGILGLGGLGHMGVKFAAAMGAEVTMLSTSPSKEADAKRLGAHHFALTTDAAQMAALAYHFDFILNTVSAKHDYNAFLNLLKVDGTMVLVGAPPEPMPLSSMSLIFGRRRLAGSLIGGIPETQEMLDFCAEKGIVSDVEVINMADVNAAYERVIKADVRYRFVIDLKSLN
jgi:alcohol dehydrogenase (NADP+)